MSILVVEDNLDAAESLRDILDLAGYSSVLAENGNEVLEKFRPGLFRWVLLDLNIPGMRGQELIQRLFQVDPQVRIIVLTGNSVKEEIEGVSKLPVVGLLRKPYDPAKLLQMISA